ncbi:MAG: hypothetical protein U9R02_01200 [Thermodesulfobacteriota bacterium]|nr:hypothetical protein [Thermodesulfobacteriota bacterium]
MSKSTIRMIYFPVLMIAVYGIIFAFMPGRAFLALKSSAIIFSNIIIPLGLVFILMIALNLFLKPAYIASFFGKGAGIKGSILSMTAGIISTGPIYAWYPMLKELKEKGAGSSSIAVFMNSRAVKPFLLPIMISCFGCLYVAILTVFTITGALVAGYLVGALVEKKKL